MLGSLGVGGECLGLGAQDRFAFAAFGQSSQLEPKRATGRTQRLVGGDDHPPQARPPVGDEEGRPDLITVRAELLQSGAEGFARKHERLLGIEHAEVRVDSGGDGVLAQQPAAEAVNGRDPGSIELAGEIMALALVQSRADARAQLAGGAVGVSDDEQGVDREPTLDRRPAEALDQHRRLAGAGAGRYEHDSGGFDRTALLAIGSARSHRLGTRHRGASRHQLGHRFFEPGPSSRPSGSWRTSPVRTRATKSRALAAAHSTLPQKGSSSR